MLLFKQVAPNQFLYPSAALAHFHRQRELYPHRLQLALPDRLEERAPVPAGVMEKWKLILFGLDFNMPAYTNCLGYPQLAQHVKERVLVSLEHENTDEICAVEQLEVQ